MVVAFDVSGQPRVEGHDLLEPAIERKKGKAGQSEEREREREKRDGFGMVLKVLVCVWKVLKCFEGLFEGFGRFLKGLEGV